MAARSVHTVRVSGGWGNKTAGASRVPKVFKTQAQAIAAGRQTAIRNGAEQEIHGVNGRIRESNSYGNDPRDTKG